MLRFRDVLGAVQALESRGDDSVPITGVAYDSRAVQRGDLFVAIPGLRRDGREFVPDAVARGAAAVLAGAALPDPGVPSGVVASPRRALAEAAAALHGHPGRKLKLVGVTGTDGKTTTSHLAAALLEAAGHRVGLISTVAVRVGGVSWMNGTNHTTPQAPELQALLARMVAAGVEYAVVEVSSHALALERVAGCDFDVAVFTNLTPEHLDFHGTMAEYLRAKGRLFEMLGEGHGKGSPRAGVVNADDPAAEYLAGVCPAPVLTYGIERSADIVARDIRLGGDGARFVVEGPFGEVEVRTPLAARFNVANWLGAIGAAVSQGAGAADIAAAALAAPPVPGRLQRIDLGQPYAVIVDFAHTPNALARALEAARATTGGRLIAVFGHAGGRDALNRPLLGEEAGRLADYTVLTTDDPYDESPAAIAGEIAAGLERVGRRAGVDYETVIDRREAIARALALATPGDAVLIAGRGHERSTTVRGQRLEFDDVAEVVALLRGEPPVERAA